MKDPQEPDTQASEPGVASRGENDALVTRREPPESARTSRTADPAGLAEGPPDVPLDEATETLLWFG